LLLETSWEAIVHAGLNPATMADSRTGVFVGLTHADYALLAADARALEGPYGFTGNNFSLASGRIADTLSVHGPAAAVDSACSSGLLAVHMACRILHEGESDPAVAGGRLGDAGTAEVGLGVCAGHAGSDRTLSWAATQCHCATSPRLNHTRSTKMLLCLWFCGFQSFQ
jgi:acyl transferase domain-containing protein